MTKKLTSKFYPFLLPFLLLFSLTVNAQFKPSDISGLSFWISGDSVQQTVAPFISTVYDLSPAANHANQVNQVKQPKVIPSFLNGHAVIKFDGTDDFLQFNSINDIRTVFWVIKEDPNAVANFRLLLGHSSNFDFYRSSNTIWAGPNTNTSILSGETKLNTLVVDGVLTPVPTRFSLISVVTTGNVTADNLSIDRNISDRVWYGEVAEIIIYNQALSPAEVSQIEQYIKLKYAPPVQLGADKIVCSLPYTIKAKQNHLQAYQWQDASTSDSLVVNVPGTYSVTTTDIFGGISADTIVITLDNSNYAVNLGNDTAICLGETLQLNAGANHLTYLWSTGAQTNTILVDSSGVYSVSVTNCLGNTFVDSKLVTVNPLPVFSLGADRVFCYNTDKTLDPGSFSSANGYSFLWSDNSSDTLLHFSNSGEYALKLTDNATCSFYDTVAITVDSSLFSISLGADQSLCSGNFIYLVSGASPGLTYQWNDLSTNDSLKITATSGSSNYSVEVTNSNLCVNNDTVNITVTGVAPALDFTTTDICLGGTIQFANLSTSIDSIASRLWDFGDLTTSDSLSPQHTYADTGLYVVRLTETTDIGCSASKFKTVHVYPLPVAAFITSGTNVQNQNSSFIDQTLTFGYPIVNWTWNFGDVGSGINNISQLHFPFHTYSDSGNYQVNLIVKSDKACVDTLVASVYINPAATANIGFMPSDLSGLEIWLTGDSAQLEGTSNAIKKVFDLSSAANHALQVDSIERPQLVSNALNGHDLMRFDGTDDFLQFEPIDSIRTAFWILKEDANAVSGFRLLLGDSSSFDFYRDNTPIWAGANVNPNILAGETKLNRVLVNGQTTPMPTNYAMISLVSSDIVQADNFTYDRNNAGRVWDGDLAELIIYNQPLSLSNQAQVENYLMNKYAAPVNLGPDKMVCSFPFTLKVYQNYFLSYQWQDASTADSLVVAGPGNYYVTVTDIFGRISSDTISIGLDNTKYFLNLGADVNTCEGLELFLNAGPSHLTYQWSTGAVSSILKVDTSGTYQVSVTDCLGNTSSDTIKIEFNPLPVFDLGVNRVVCYNEDFKLRTQLVFPQPNYYQFLWSTNSIDTVIVPTSSGAYSLMVSDPIGCRFTDTITIQMDSLLFPSTLGPDTSFCSGNYIQLQQGAAAVASYLWNTGDTTSNLQIIQPLGTNYIYSVLLKDSLACQKRDTISVDITGIAPSISFTFDTTVCIGSTTQFMDMSSAPVGDTLVSWLWNFGDNTTSNAQNPQHLFGAPGLYTVQLRIGTNGGCSAVLTKSVRISAYPIANFTNPSSCAFNETVFTNTSSTFGSPLFSYNWNFGDPASGFNNTSDSANPIHIFTARDTFNITFSVTNIYGCADTIAKTIITKPSPVAIFSDTIACEGYQITLTDNSTYPFPQFGLSRSWDFNDGSPIETSTPLMPLFTVSHFYPLPGNYSATLAIQASNGCRDAITKNIFILSKPKANFSYTKNCINSFTEFTDLSVQDSSYAVDSIVSWNWLFDNGPSSTLQNPRFKFTTPGTHTARLIVTTLRGCSDTVEKFITVKQLPLVSFTKSAVAGDPPLLVSFTNSSSVQAVLFNWDFGDTGSSTLENPSHTYADTGIFTITLTASDTSGCAGSASQTITVKVAKIDVAVLAVKGAIDSENYLHVKADLQNKSTRVITSMELYNQINGQSPAKEIWTGVLPINGYVTYSFAAAQKIDEDESSTFVCVTAAKPNGINDYFPSDNESCASFAGNIFTLSNPFPNPTANTIVFPVILPEDATVTYRIFDSEGRMVLESTTQSFNKGLNQLSIDMRSYRSAIYAFQISYKGESLVKRFVKTSEK